jgi:hypothetical protein
MGAPVVAGPRSHARRHKTFRFLRQHPMSLDLVTRPTSRSEPGTQPSHLLCGRGPRRRLVFPTWTTRAHTVSPRYHCRDSSPGATVAGSRHRRCRAVWRWPQPALGRTIQHWTRRRMSRTLSIRSHGKCIRQPAPIWRRSVSVSCGATAQPSRLESTLRQQRDRARRLELSPQAILLRDRSSLRITLRRSLAGRTLINPSLDMRV